jgi:hypothetical protein
MSNWPQFERVLVIPVDKLDQWLAQLTPTPELLADLNKLFRDANLEIRPTREEMARLKRVP